jgi:hypothetical protein
MSKKKKLQKKRTDLKHSTNLFFRIWNLFPESNLLDKNIKYSWIYLIIILAVGFIIRVHNLEMPPNLNNDEMNHIGPAIDYLNGTGYIKGQGMAFTYLVFLAFKLFGINESAARIPGVIIGSLNIILVYIFAKKLYGKRIAIISSMVVCFSFFEIIFSRITRFYIILQLFFLVSLFLFYLAFECNNNSTNPLSKKIFISPIYLITFFIVYSLSIIFINPWIITLWISGTIYFFTKYLILRNHLSKSEKRTCLISGTASLIIIISGAIIIKSGLLNFILYVPLDQFFPSFDRLLNQLKKSPFEGLSLYLSIIVNDFKYLWIIGSLGFVFSFKVLSNKKLLIFLHTFFISHLLILSYVFIEYNQRYFLAAYIIYPIYVAIGIAGIIDIIERHLKMSFQKLISIIAVFILFFLTIPLQRFVNLYDGKMYKGACFDRDFTFYAFYPYRRSCLYVEENLKDTDMIMTNNPSIVTFYLKNKNVFKLYQKAVDYIDDKDVFYNNDTIVSGSLINHKSFLEFIKTIRAAG